MYVGLYEVAVETNRERDRIAEQDHHARDCEVGFFTWLAHLLKSVFSSADQ